MASERNVLRYGGMTEVQAILDARPPASMDEVRAVLLNLIENWRFTNGQLEQHEANDSAHAPRVS